MSGVIRLVTKLDGSESNNVIKQPNAPTEYVQVSTTTWDGDSLVTRTPVRDGPVPFVLTKVMRLEGATLVIQATQTIEATGAVLNQVVSPILKVAHYRRTPSSKS